MKNTLLIAMIVGACGLAACSKEPVQETKAPAVEAPAASTPASAASVPAPAASDATPAPAPAPEASAPTAVVTPSEQPAGSPAVAEKSTK